MTEFRRVLFRSCMHRDIPPSFLTNSLNSACSLYAQGYTEIRISKTGLEIMFPVCTGIYRLNDVRMLTVDYVPCMHRDIPIISIVVTSIRGCSLYAQGYTAALIAGSDKKPMFPVCTGIYRSRPCKQPTLTHVPCMHRDIP